MEAQDMTHSPAEAVAVRKVSPDEPEMGVPALAKKLGVTRTTLWRAVHMGYVAATLVEGKFSIDGTEVARWKAYFTTLPPRFDWLQSVLESHPQASKMLKVNAVCHRLGVQPGVVTGLSKEGFLPFFERSFSPRKHIRIYPAIYIDGLAGFIGDAPFRMHLTNDCIRDYAGLCKSQKRIS